MGWRQLSSTGFPAPLASSDRQQVPLLRSRKSLYACMQEEVDDLIHDEAEEVADAEDALRTHRQVDLRERRDMTNEEVERYIKERFEEPALREAQLRDDGAQAGARHGCFQAFSHTCSQSSAWMILQPCCTHGLEVDVVLTSTFEDLVV